MIVAIKKIITFLILFINFAFLFEVAKSYQIEKVLNKSILILKGPFSDGSAVVIGKKNNKYLIITAKHILGSSNEDSYVITPQKTTSKLKILKTFDNYDISLGIFNSSENIIPVPLNIFLNYPAPYTAESYSKFLNLKSKFNTVTNEGLIAGYSLETNAVPFKIFRLINAKLITLLEKNLDGYDLLYQASTVRGMSGGGVFGYRDCSNGRGFGLGISPDLVFPILLGIHGRSEDYHGEGKSGISLGIPIKNEIKDFITANAEEYGVPMGEKNIRKLVNENFCI